MSFAKYTDAVLSALQFNPKQPDVIARKQEILNGIYNYENLTPASILFVGFNPAILSCQAKTIAVTEISETALAFLDQNKIRYTYIDPKDFTNYKKQFQAVVAMDEYFTFANSDIEQQIAIAKICDMASDFVISTVRDYKNQEFKDREFSQPIMIRNGLENKIFVESHNWDLKDRTRWNTRLFEINSNNELKLYGVFERRTMFFKQLAKFSMDAGAVNFLVHKNLMYKSLIKRNYEHVISIQFNNQ